MRSRPRVTMAQLCSRPCAAAMDGRLRDWQHGCGNAGGGDPTGVPPSASECQEGTREPSVERGTVDIYERNAAAWRDRRPPRFREHAAAFAARVRAGAVRLD